MADYANFRQQLDALLRTRDVEQVRNFLIAKEQWSEELPADPEFAMWMVAIQCGPVYTFNLKVSIIYRLDIKCSSFF